MESTALSRQSIMAIMSNELRRRLEVFSENLPLKERISVVDKYTQQLVNSGYNRKQIREIIISALTGYIRT